jgi:hypothetical protein
VSGEFNREFDFARPSGDPDAVDVYAIADGGPHEAIRFHSDDGDARHGPEFVTS